MFAMEPQSFAESLGSPIFQGGDDGILQRIQSAIPEIQNLVTRYRETSGQLGERELNLRQTQAQRDMVMKEKDAHISRLHQECEDLTLKHKTEIQKHTEEKDKLRLEVGNITDKHTDLDHVLQAEKKNKEDAEKKVQELEKRINIAEAKNTDLLTDRQKFQADVFRGFEEKEKAFAETTEQKIQDTVQMEVAAKEKMHASEKATMERSWHQAKRELNETISKLLRDLEDSRIRQRRYSQEREAWNQERDSLHQTWEHERANKDKGSEDLMSQHRKEMDDLQREKTATEARLKELESTLSSVQAERDSLKAGWDAEKVQFNQIRQQLLDAAKQLNIENARLQRVAEACEAITDLRERGDPY